MANGRSRSAESYHRQRMDAAERSRDRSKSGRDIGELPAVVNPKRRAKAAKSLRYFCEAYFPHTYELAWSPDHLKVIGKIEEAVTAGGLFAMAMPRGSGKSSLCETGCIWAKVNGYQEFVCLIGSSAEHALRMLESIKAELESNELLAEDYPEVCYPIQKLEGIAARCRGQLYKGERTHITWNADELVLPTMPDSKAAGAIVKAAGITGTIRGMKAKRSDGRTVRPTLVVLDDPQTDESAKSPAQCAERERILAGAVLGLSGPGKKISGIMPCTVIQPGDMADKILDRQKHPEWNGERTKMVYKWPTDEKLWAEYAEIRAEGLRRGDGGKAATTFYRKNRKAMDAGAEVSWPQRHNADELSGLQNAMNLRLRDEAAFFAEYQNEPIVEQRAEERGLLSQNEIATKVNGYERGVVPADAVHLTMFIDVQGALLYYLVAAWREDFTGYVLDYGSYPDQGRKYYTLRDAKKTLKSVAPQGAGPEGQIYAGLTALTDATLGREWKGANGAALKIGRCLIDANWNVSTDTVYAFCRQSPHSAVLMPSHGKYVGAANKPMREWRKTPGERVGHNWRVPPPTRRATRHVLIDTNFWKTFVHARLSLAMGDRGCLSLFQARPADHRLLADHLLAEYRISTSGRGRDVDEWKPKPGKLDNHWLDCLVGAAVAGSMLGAVIEGTAVGATKPRQRVRMSDLQDARQGRGGAPAAPAPTAGGRQRVRMSDLQRERRAKGGR